MGRVRAGLAGVLVVVAAAVAVAEKAKITTHVSERFSFARPLTYAWADPSGTLKFLQVTETDPERWRRVVEPTIVRSVDTELGRRGYTQAPREQADIVANYYVLVGPDVAMQRMGQFMAPTMEWGLPPFQGRVTSYDIAEQGSLVIDLLAREQNLVVWRGVVQARVHLEKSDAERNVNIARRINELFKKYPKK
jgi:hypothetical protein